jgi:hypothetical protein
MMTKGQATLEMIISVSFLVLIFLIIVLLALNKSTESSQLKSYLDAKRIGESVRDNINMISQQGPGYYKYFSVPEEIHGSYEYNITISQNVLEVMWADQTWSTQLITPDVRVYSLDKGLTKLNKVMDRDGVIEITGHRPNLRPDCGSLNITSDGTMMNVTFDILNDAHVGDSNVTSASFSQICGGAVPELVQTPPIPAFDRVKVFLNYTIQCLPLSSFSLRADYGSELSEGIESDNECNATVF